MQTDNYTQKPSTSRRTRVVDTLLSPKERATAVCIFKSCCVLMKERKNFTHVIREAGNEISNELKVKIMLDSGQLNGQISSRVPDEDCVEIRFGLPIKYVVDGALSRTPDRIRICDLEARHTMRSTCSDVSLSFSCRACVLSRLNDHNEEDALDYRESPDGYTKVSLLKMVLVSSELTTTVVLHLLCIPVNEKEIDRSRYNIFSQRHVV